MFVQRIINKYLKHAQISRITFCQDSEVFLTFDDGPDVDITDFVLNELKKYDFKATFFCCGKNAEKNPHLLDRIKREGHTIANHTYNHLIATEHSASDFISDVEQANKILKTSYFRPPCAIIKLNQWIRLKSKYKFFFWSKNSGDYMESHFDLQKNLQTLFETKTGDIVLFHFCKLHANETKQILPVYLEWLHEHKFKAVAISEKNLKRK